MLKSVLLSSLGVALLLPAAATARERTTDKNDPNKVICRSDDSTGSRLSRTKQCLTVAQWAEQRRQNQQDISKIQSQSYKNPSE